jgi:undecaprenyl diphosphate synthase
MWDNGRVVASLARRRVAAPTTAPDLAHILVVGGTQREWAALGAERWRQRVTGLGVVAARAGARWLTLRAYTEGEHPVELDRWQQVVEGGGTSGTSCTVIVDPRGDGRERFAEAIRELPAELGRDEPVPAEAVTAVLYAPADAEPDLVLVLGPPNRLPPSLVWELAYGELVFADAAWDELATDHLTEAISVFAARQRRFGGLG